jgi:tetratricopeptide (TPR) repeat protein
MGDLQNAIDDALEAIELNPDNIKAYLIYGVSLCEKCKKLKNTKQIDKAVDLIQKGIGLCMKEGKRHFEPRMRQCIRRAWKLKYLIDSEQELERNKQIYIKVMKKVQVSKVDISEKQKELLKNLLDP